MAILFRCECCRWQERRLLQKHKAVGKHQANICLVLILYEIQGLDLETESGTMRPSHLVDAQSATTRDQPAGCSASLHAAARSKANVDQVPLVPGAMTEDFLVSTSLATISRISRR